MVTKSCSQVLEDLSLYIERKGTARPVVLVIGGASAHLSQAAVEFAGSFNTVIIRSPYKVWTSLCPSSVMNIR